MDWWIIKKIGAVLNTFLNWLSQLFKTILKSNSNQEERKTSIIVKFLIIIPLIFLVPFVIALVYAFFNINLQSIEINGPFWIEVQKFYTGFWGLFIGFITAIVSFFNVIKKQFVSEIKDIKKQFVSEFNYVGDELNKKIDKHLQKTKIVFESGINDYDEKYLSVIQKILNEFEIKYGEIKADGTLNTQKVTDLYFIDHSSPIKWWSESMTGYMALISKWRANGLDRKVRRFFIYSENELLSPVTVKTIAFHSLMGFNTYIFSDKHFNKIFEQFMKDKDGHILIDKRELFIWNNSTNYTVNFSTNDDVSWSQILLYQSFWNIEKHHKSERDILIENPNFIWFDYLGQPKMSKEIFTWFEFIPKNRTSIEMSSQFMEFIEKYLIPNTFCCMYQNDLNKIPDNLRKNGFGIKIKSIDCNLCRNNNQTNIRCVSTEEANGTKFGYTNSSNIAEILNRYSNT